MSSSTSSNPGIGQVAISTQINNLVVENGVVVAKEHSAQMDSFISTPSTSSVLILESLKGRLADKGA